MCGNAECWGPVTMGGGFGLEFRLRESSWNGVSLWK